MKEKKENIIVHRSEATKETLQSIYNVANEIAKELQSKGIDISDCFFTEKEWKEVKKNKNYKFI